MIQKIHVDILTPKQVLFFTPLLKKLAEHDITTLLTTRKYREVNQMMGLNKIHASVIGKHGKGDIAGKLEASLKRTLKLSRFFKDTNPNLSLSFSSPEAARVSYGLGIPHITVNDSPHAEAVAKLTIPLSRKILTPAVIPIQAWQKYGATKKMIVKYNALDPFVWLKEFKPDKKILQIFGLQTDEHLVTVRPEESFASYLLNKTRGKTLIIKIIEKLLTLKDVKIIVLPRYEEQIKILKNKFDNKIIIAEKAVDGASLLFFSSVFIGGGGTMTSESALIGVPTFSCYPEKSTFVEKYLIQKGLVTRINDPDLLTKSVTQTLKTLDETRPTQMVRAKKLISNMEDPTEVILKTILSFLNNR